MDNPFSLYEFRAFHATIDKKEAKNELFGLITKKC